MSTVFAVASLDSARVAIIGLGALGCQVSHVLANAGVGHLTLVDDDHVESSNLQRQHLFGAASIGSPKVSAAAGAIRSTIPCTIDITPIEEHLIEPNAQSLLRGHDVVVDATDDPTTKFLLNRECLRAGVPLVHGGAMGTAGLAMTVSPGVSACVACAFAPRSTDVDAGCAQLGILAPVAGVIGSLQAFLTLKLVLGDHAAEGILYAYELRAQRWRTMRVPRDPLCVACGVSPDSVA